MAEFALLIDARTLNATGCNSSFFGDRCRGTGRLPPGLGQLRRFILATLVNIRSLCTQHSPGRSDKFPPDAKTFDDRPKDDSATPIIQEGAPLEGDAHGVHSHERQRRHLRRGPRRHDRVWSPADVQPATIELPMIVKLQAGLLGPVCRSCPLGATAPVRARASPHLKAEAIPNLSAAAGPTTRSLPRRRGRLPFPSPTSTDAQLAW